MTNWYDETITKQQNQYRTNVIFLDREYDGLNGTWGTMTFYDGTEFDTIELPWKDNTQRISCVPEGEYILRKRYSPIVERTSGGKYSQGWEVTDVPNRTYIMIHVANTPSDLAGCIGPGLTKGHLGGERAVLSSRTAFTQLMTKMEDHDEWVLVVREAS